MPGHGGGGGRGGGGGFRGGGFRGGPPPAMKSGAGGVNFRSGTPYSAPFSRAGGYRNINGPAGPYRHTPYNHPHAGYYGYGSRWWAPWRGWGWWNRWYYGPYYGYGYGPYGYGYGGYGYGYPYRRSFTWVACCIFLVFILVFVGIFYNVGGYFGQFGNTQSLGFNSDYTQTQYANANDNLTFSFSTQSPAVPLTVAISSVPLSGIPTISESGTYTDAFNLASNYYEYESFFFNTGSTFNVTFTCSASVDFFIADATNFNSWDQYQSYSTFYENTSISSITGLIAPSLAGGVPSSQDYYLVWYNTGGPSSISVSLTVNYTRTGVYDFSSTLYHQADVTSLTQTTVNVPSTGTWYYILYFDPWNSDQASTEVASSLTLNQSIPSSFPWIYVVPIIVVAIIIITCVSVLASRKKARQALASTQKTGSPGTSPPSQVPPENQAQIISTNVPPAAGSTTCISCGAELSPGATYCGTCGRKLAGRQIAKPRIITPRQSEYCSLCGANLEPGMRFCQNCGTPIE